MIFQTSSDLTKARANKAKSASDQRQIDEHAQFANRLVDNAEFGDDLGDFGEQDALHFVLEHHQFARRIAQFLLQLLRRLIAKAKVAARLTTKF